MESIESIQKVIKVGDSIAVTIPAKDARVLGIKPGSYVKSRHEKILSSHKSKNLSIVNDYEKFVDQYGSALKNLADR